MGLKSGIQDSEAVIFRRKSADFSETDHYLKKNDADSVACGIFLQHNNHFFLKKSYSG